MDLRPHQRAVTGAMSAGWSEWQVQLTVPPTGAGKTMGFSPILAEETGLETCEGASEWIDDAPGGRRAA